MMELTIFTTAGPVDLVAVSRWLSGEDLSLTPAETRACFEAVEQGLVPMSLTQFGNRTGKKIERLRAAPALRLCNPSQRIILIPVNQKAA